MLALQGDFEAHQKALERAGAEAIQVRTAEELENIDGLVIPGGESTTMLKLLHFMDLKEPLREFATRSRFSAPARAPSCWPGTCAIPRRRASARWI